MSHNTDWAKIYDGVVCDVPNCELGRHGEHVSFNSILKKYKLTDSTLILLGEIVRAGRFAARDEPQIWKSVIYDRGWSLKGPCRTIASATRNVE